MQAVMAGVKQYQFEVYQNPEVGVGQLVRWRGLWQCVDGPFSCHSWPRRISPQQAQWDHGIPYASWPLNC